MEEDENVSLADIPLELDKNVLLELSDEDLVSACKTDKRAADMCADDNFWNERLKHIFGYNLNKYKEKEEVSYRDMYEFFIKYQNLESSQIINNAIRLRYLPILKYIIEEIRPDFDINHVLQIAASVGDVNSFRYLVAKGFHTSFKFNIASLLLSAVDGNNLDIVRYISTFKPNYNLNLNQALKDAVLYRRNIPIIKLLINAGATNVNTALELAADDLELIKYLITEAGATNLNDALIEASVAGNLNNVKYLVEAGATDMNNALLETLDSGTTLNHDVVDYLIYRGANVYIAKEKYDKYYLKQLRR